MTQEPPSRRFRLARALLPQGWSRDVCVSIDANGRISLVETAAEQAAPTATLTGTPSAATAVEYVAGTVVPGMPNAHSHAFQRGMAGDTEYRLSARDSFWTWRRAMYALANRIEPEDLQILATQLFIEMLKVGYTSVAEFHYLNRQRDGTPYAPGNALWDAVAQAALAAGIALTFLPTLYQTSDFGARPLNPDQSRFAMDTDEYLRAVGSRIDAERRKPSPTLRTGAAFHSLRAVPLATLREVSPALRAMDPSMPLHIHVAEQVKEVDACKRSTGRRPIELLLDTGLLDAEWCLVHATHATPDELQGIAGSGAAVCVSISTEANLGDGFFDASRFLSMSGRLCVGSDSQATVCPAEELRWLEYQQRLKKRRRGVLADEAESHAGTRLWRDSALHGAHAIGRDAGRIAVGHQADWLVLDAAHPSMAGAPLDNSLDHLVFAGGSAAIRDVMVAGQWVIKDRRHSQEETSTHRFADLMNRLNVARVAAP